MTLSTYEDNNSGDYFVCGNILNYKILSFCQKKKINYFITQGFVLYSVFNKTLKNIRLTNIIIVKYRFSAGSVVVVYFTTHNNIIITFAHLFYSHTC